MAYRDGEFSINGVQIPRYDASKGFPVQGFWFNRISGHFEYWDHGICASETTWKRPERELCEWANHWESDPKWLYQPELDEGYRPVDPQKAAKRRQAKQPSLRDRVLKKLERHPRDSTRQWKKRSKKLRRKYADLLGLGPRPERPKAKPVCQPVVRERKKKKTFVPVILVRYQDGGEKHISR